MAIRNMRIDYGIPRVATVVGIRVKNREREKERRGRKGKEIKGDGWKKKEGDAKLPQPLPRSGIINVRLDLAGHLVGFDSLERATIEII